MEPPSRSDSEEYEDDFPRSAHPRRSNAERPDVTFGPRGDCLKGLSEIN
jgi:hypothetical protein